MGFFSIESVRALLIAEETEAQGREDSCGYTGHNGGAQASDPSMKGSKSPQTNTAPRLTPGTHAMSSEDILDGPEASLCGLEADLMSLPSISHLCNGERKNKNAPLPLSVCEDDKGMIDLF